jgi:N-acetyl-anhydromuramyl-L-alanine amidase AmpD
MGYHFLIGNGNKSPDGRIEAGPRWRKQQTGAHAGVNKYNRYGIGICLVGSLHKKRPSAKQLAALRDLVRYLCHRYNISVSNVKGHSQIKCTQCPGKYFPMEEFRKELKRVM